MWLVLHRTQSVHASVLLYRFCIYNKCMHTHLHACICVFVLIFIFYVRDDLRSGQYWAKGTKDLEDVIILLYCQKEDNWFSFYLLKNEDK